MNPTYRNSIGFWGIMTTPMREDSQNMTWVLLIFSYLNTSSAQEATISIATLIEMLKFGRAVIMQRNPTSPYIDWNIIAFHEVLSGSILTLLVDLSPARMRYRESCRTQKCTSCTPFLIRWLNILQQSTNEIPRRLSNTIRSFDFVCRWKLSSEFIFIFY